jgi:predicted GNAT family N-acyltransferase
MYYDSVSTIPRQLEAQIRYLLSTEWPGPDADDAAQPLIDPKLHPTYVVLADGDQVISYSRTIWAMVSHLGQCFKLYGLGDVITRPEFRQQGYGGRIVEEATTYIKLDPDADAALLLTEPKLESFYRRSGWDSVPGLRVTTSEEYSERATLPMMLFLSAKALAAQEIFSKHTLVLPGDEW